MADSLPDLPGAIHRRVDAGEVHLHLVELGAGPPVVFLHGFPEFWWSWRRQLPALAAAGFRAVAPDLRGYGGSDKPPEVDAYALPRLAADVAGLVRSLGVGRAAVIGHDWGGVVAWEFAAHYPELLDRLAVLNAPHPASLLRALRRPAQLLRSSYMALFQLPAVPERLLFLRDGALLRRGLRAGRTTPAGKAELDAYVEAGRAANALRGGLDYYRAMGRRLVQARFGGARGSTGSPRPGVGSRGGRIDAPVLVIWGERDAFLGPELATPPRHVVPEPRVERIPGAGHGVMLDAADEVNRLLVEFLRTPRAATAS